MAIKGRTIVITYTAWDLNTASPIAGDISNHTCRLSIDGASFVSATNTPVELGYGVYALTLTSSETNCNSLTLQVSSSTSQIVVPPVQIAFEEECSVPTASSIATAVWTTTLTGVIPGQNSMYSKVMSIPGSVWTNNNRTLTSISVTSGLNTYSLATTANLDSKAAQIITHGDSNWRSSSGITAADVWGYTGGRTITNTIPTVSQIQSGLATSTDISNAQTAIIAAIPTPPTVAQIQAGLSTFDPATDTVLIDSTQAAGMATATGFATVNDVSNAETAIIAAIPTVPTDYAKAGDTMTLSSTDINSIRNGLATETDISNAQSAVINAMPDVSGLSTFDAATDRVIIDATQAATMKTATGFATPADIPSASAVAEAVWNTDLTDITASDTAAKQIYTALNNCATATDTAVISAELDEILGGVLHWSVNYNTLTVYGPNNTPIRTYSITRDESGNITQLTPNG